MKVICNQILNTEYSTSDQYLSVNV